MPNIDDLSISVKSNVTSATNSIDKLITKLSALSASLGQVNTSGFSAMASGIRQISNASNSISGNSAKNITELSLAIRKFGGKASTQATANIPQLGNALMQLSNSMASVGGMTFNTEGITNLASAINKLGGVKSSTAVQNIPQLTVALQGMVGSLNQIGTAGQSITALGQLSSSLSKLGGKTVTNALTNIPQLTNALMQMMSTLSKAPQVSYNVIQLVNSLANLASQGSKVGTASNSLYNGFMRFGKGADHARKKSFSLASAIGKLYAKYFLLLRLFRGIGKGIGLASDLTEVENVVNASFGRFKNQEITLDYKINGEEYVTSIEKLGETSIQDFGMSELTAKKISSRFQAMGGAIGFSQDEMAKMSLTLTALSADMASFYNVEQKAVAEDLEAIITGMTRPLRTYGIDLTQTTLQEWALSQGMEANIATMTQAEKVLLRYNYVLAQTGMAQGDFQRTQGTWANQIRILRQQFEALGAIIGQNFIYALKPVVTALNTVMAKLIQFARVVSNSLGKIFGWKYEDTTGGIVDDLEYGAEAADDLGSGLGGAANNAKKLKQQLQGFDELNVLTTNEPSSGGGGGGGVGGDSIASGNTGQWVKDSGLFDFESDLDSLYKLGDYIGTTLTNQLRSIDWQKVYQGAKNFGSGLASFLNGLISPELFSAVGATIAGALNTAIYTALSFGETFDFKEFGLSIAEGINTFFRDTDFKAFAQNMNVWAKGIKDLLVTIIKEIDWSEVLKGIGDFLGSLDAETVILLLGFKAFGLVFSGGLLSTLGGSLASAILPTTLISGLSTLSANIFSTFIKSLGVAFLGFNLGEWIYEQITGDDTSDINYIDYFVGEGKASAKEWRDAFVEWIKDNPLTTEEWQGFIPNSESAGLLGDADALNKVSKMYKKDFQTLEHIYGDDSVFVKYEKAYRNFWGRIGYEASAGTKKVTKILSVFGVDANEILTEMSSDGKDIIIDFVKTGELDFSNLSDNGKKYIEMLKGGVTEKLSSLKNGVNTIFSNIKSIGTNNFKGLSSNLNTSTNATVSGVTSGFNLLKNNISTLTNSASSSATQNFGSLKNNGINATDLLYNKVKSYYGDMKGTISNETSSMSSSATNNFNSLNSNANTSMISLFNIVRERMSATTGVVQGQNWSTPGQNLVQGLKDGISARWSQGGNSLISLIQQLASNLTSALKKALGIHSPSRLWRDEIGNQLSAGLGIGILDGEDSLVKSVVGMGNRLTNSFSGSLTLATPSNLSGNYNFGVTSTMAHSFSADTSMTSNIADGVRQGLSSSQAEQNALLREQNELLMRILDKTGISSSDLFSAVRRESRQHYNQTGTNAFVF